MFLVVFDTFHGAWPAAGVIGGRVKVVMKNTSEWLLTFTQLLLLQPIARTAATLMLAVSGALCKSSQIDPPPSQDEV